MGFTSVGIGSTANYGFLQFFGTPNTLCWTANGTVGIGTTNPGAPLYLFAASTGLPNGIMSVFSSSILSSTASSYDILQRWYESSSNASFVDLMWVRGSTGSNWETTSQRFQAKTDGTWQSFIEFNGPNNNYGVTIGTGSSTSNPNSVPGVLYVKQGGLVGIGMTNPATTLHITQTLGITSYYSTFGTASAMPAQLILETPTTHRLYMGSYYTPGQSEVSVIQSSAYFSSTDHAGVLLLNPNGGLVGIGGTNIPGYTLDVSGSSSALGLSATRSTAGISGSGRISYYNGTNSVLYWLLGSISSSVGAFGGSIDINGDLVRIDTALKNVQFGCSVNYGNFTVNRSSASGSTGTTNGNIVVYRNTTTSFYDVYLVFASASSFVGDIIYSNASFMYLTPNFVAAPSPSGTYLLVVDHSVNTYMAITNSGYVGIGTAAPTAPLHVYDALGVSLSNTAAVNYTQSAILGFNFGGGTGVGTRDSFRILSQTVNRDNGAGPTFFDYGAQADLVFQRKTNNLYSGGANDMTYTEVMRIGGATGNVGIGTIAPIYRLQIEQGFSNNSNGLFISNTNYGSMQGLNISMVNAGSGNFNSYAALQGFTSGVAAGSTPICLQPSSGNVGIGTTNPGYPLQIGGSANYTYGVSWYYGGSGQVNQGGNVTSQVSLFLAQWGVTGAAWGVTSDRRIKTNIEPVSNILDIIQQVNVVKYDYIDPQYGREECSVIAQDLQAVFPNAINITTDYVPNIFKICSHVQHEDVVTLSVTLASTSDNIADIKVGSTLKMMISDDGKTERDVIVSILSVSFTEHTIQVSSWENYDEHSAVFVYGTEVKNFLSVDKPQLGVMALQGVKELQQIVIQQEERITKLEALIAKLTS
jgi:hypothetical protein